MQGGGQGWTWLEMGRYMENYFFLQGDVGRYCKVWGGGLCSKVECCPWLHCRVVELRDEYANHIPNPKHMPKYAKAKVPRTQDKHTSAEQLCRAMLPLPLPYKKPCCPIRSLAATCLSEYVATHSQPTGSLCPCKLDKNYIQHEAGEGRPKMLKQHWFMFQRSTMVQIY